jgi:hypothetical protein
MRCAPQQVTASEGAPSKMWLQVKEADGQASGGCSDAEARCAVASVGRGVGSGDGDAESRWRDAGASLRGASCSASDVCPCGHRHILFRWQGASWHLTRACLRCMAQEYVVARVARVAAVRRKKLVASAL